MFFISWQFLPVWHAYSVLREQSTWPSPHDIYSPVCKVLLQITFNAFGNLRMNAHFLQMVNGVSGPIKQLTSPVFYHNHQQLFPWFPVLQLAANLTIYQWHLQIYLKASLLVTATLYQGQLLQHNSLIRAVRQFPDIRPKQSSFWLLRSAMDFMQVASVSSN